MKASQTTAKALALSVLAFAGLLQPVAAAGASAKSVKISVLSGQSNMTGRATLGDLKKPATEQKATLVRYIMEPQNMEKCKFLYAGPQKNPAVWTIRDDVFITNGERHGGLTTNYGGFRNNGFGPEFPIGHLLGDYHDEPVLLVKVAFGGRNPVFGKPEAKAAAEKVIAAQLAVAKRPEFKDAAVTVETRDFYRPQDPFGGNKQGIHWHANGESYWLVGEAMGRGMLGLLPAKTAKP